MEKNWKEILSENAYKVLRQKGTERPFSGKYNAHFEEGTYHCRGCDAPLFPSTTKFDSGCGWPSFFDAFKENIETHIDHSHGMTRIEITCKSCKGHLGHVFPDGPEPTGQRYCVNSVAMTFRGSD